ncbi:hypothetical protein [Clostridium butyricum]|uniref:hypothetical protein n=1 Tax=Clostridium butyricum TaxID=1492 RepID=UPI0009040FB4|nr:hypothetical protein [Clostridium butyricum]APF21681.1 hypothetical protein NPD4_3497 [Clostridium butyricum]
MKINEFAEFMVYIKKLFPSVILPDDEEVILVWYKSFEDISLKIAKEMANNYFSNESKEFNYARLLKCKPEQRINASAYEPFKYDN